jgi:hypothetical protein
MTAGIVCQLVTTMGLKTTGGSRIGCPPVISGTAEAALILAASAGA